MNSKLKTQIASAIAIAFLSSGVAQAHVTYNAVDLDYDQAQEYGGWSWSDGDPGYSGNLAVTWVAFVHNDGGVANSQTASSAGAGYTLGVGARAYKDGNTNWAHNADFGLFHLAHDAEVTITMNSDGSDLRPAFGLWSGWATGGSRHSAFTGNGALSPMENNPLGPGLTVIDPNDWAYASNQGVTAVASLTTFLQAGNYTLILGGYDGTTSGQHLAYTATISAAPVPLPGVAWLFGTGLATIGFLGQRRKIYKTSAL